ncbi:lysophospholipid acyltransferase family protein [Salinimicrobium sp. GXAS 041]|uniref:lysophospholipid acyltransferase family protein n=1 Tax=Salinimicrobium sp. GXAS 041 TaxID=3400806 RepID=UPI003C7248CF
MGIFRAVLILLWRIWFYILMAIPILVLFPFLLVASSREKWYPAFFYIAKIWAVIILFGMGFIPKIKRQKRLEKGKSYMLVANHTSMTDIMLMLITIRNPFVFVGKKELAKIPIFGFFYKRTCILVDRENQRSRQEVFARAQKRLKEGTSICIFPEGGVPDDHSIVLDKFKDGAFRLAIDHQIPVVPITFHDNKKRFSYKFFSGSPGKMRVKIHPFISTAGKTQADKKELREKTRAVILEELENPSVE